MDRLTQLRGTAGGSRESGLNVSEAASDAYITANDSSKFYSLSEEDSSFDISPIKDVSLASAAAPDKVTSENDQLIQDLSPIQKKNDLLDSYKFSKQIEAANILSGGVDIFDDNDNSYDGNELVIDDNVGDMDEKSNQSVMESVGLPYQKAEEISDSVDNELDIGSKDTEVVLQIDGKNVQAIDIGNGLYLYRKQGGEELAAVQIMPDKQDQPTFKFLKVRENAEGNLEVYEEIEVEVPKEVPTKEGKIPEKNASHVPVKNISKDINDPVGSRVQETKLAPLIETKPVTSTSVAENSSIVPALDNKSEINFNGKMIKFHETRKSPVIHSTPNKEGIPLTKTMVDLQLHPSRHLDNLKTIEVHIDSSKQRTTDTQTKDQNNADNKKQVISTSDKQLKKLINEPENKDKGREISEKPIKNSNNERSFEKVGFKRAEIVVAKQSSIELCPKLKEPVVDDNKELPATKEVATSEKQIAKNTEKMLRSNNECYKTFENKDKNPHETVKSNDLDPKIEQHHQNFPDETKDDSFNFVSSSTAKEVAQSKEKKLLDGSKIVNQEAGTSNKNIKNNKKIALPEVNIPDISEGPGTPHEENINVADDNINIDDNNPDCKQSKPIKSSYGLTNLEDTKKTILAENPVSDKKFDSKIPILTANVTLQSKQSITADKLTTVETENEERPKINIQDQNVKIDKNEDEKHLPNFFDNITKVADINIQRQNVKISKNEDKKHSNLPQNVTAVLVGNVTDKTMEDNKPAILANVSPKVDEDSKQSVLAENSTIKIVPSCKQSIVSENVINKTKQGLEDRKQPILAKNDTINKMVQNYQSNTIKVQHTEKPKADEIKQGNKTSVEKKAEIKKKYTVENHFAKGVGKDTTIQCTQNDEPKAANKHKVSILPKDIRTVNAEIQLKAATVTSQTEINKQAVLCKQETESNIKINQPIAVDNLAQRKPEVKTDVTGDIKQKPINNNHAQVPFGKWTEANKQDFLNKIKETKVPTNYSNTKSLKQPTDLNRRDVLQKIDSQRQSSNASAKSQELLKHNVKAETTTFTKISVTCDTKVPLKTEPSNEEKTPSIPPKKIIKPEFSQTAQKTINVRIPVVATAKQEGGQRKEMNNQDLIDKTIEGIINRAVSVKPQELKHTKPKEQDKFHKDPFAASSKSRAKQPSPLDVIEMKMNELHGIPFVERPPHELPKVYNLDVKTYAKSDNTNPTTIKTSKIPNLLPFTNQLKPVGKDAIVDLDSEEEIIEHEPITGDMHKKDQPKSTVTPVSTETMSTQINEDVANKETIITEKDFDKFARRNSITYENCLTVINFEGNKQHNVTQALVEKEAPVKSLRNELMLAESKAKSTKHKLLLSQSHANKIQMVSKITPINDESFNKNYPSKLQMAYTALTAKPSITIIEDKPVKVVFMDTNTSFPPRQLNLQSKDLSPLKKVVSDPDTLTTSTCDSLDSEILDAIDGAKVLDEIKVKTKHQRKQVLTPVKTPELELIVPTDLGVEVSPKKKRKTEDTKLEKSVVPKKSYLLGRSVVSENPEPHNFTKSPTNEVMNDTNTIICHKDTASAIDNLVKAAELLETQSESLKANKNISCSEGIQQTPAKRGRGRPRKYPIPESTPDKAKSPSPQKKPRLIDAQHMKRVSASDDDTSDGEIVQENWTMGKINENIVCPICNKLFRSENVVFKHVKHCTGPSPNRSDSDKRSLRRSRISRESDSKSEESKSNDLNIELEKSVTKKNTLTKRKSKDLSCIKDQDSKVKHCTGPSSNRSDSAKRSLRRSRFSREFDAKSEESKFNDLNIESEKPFTKKNTLTKRKSKDLSCIKDQDSKQNDQSAAFRCEPCDKSFRKLHHLVEHRETHDSINRQKNTITIQAVEKTSPNPPPQCDVCNKTFRKLHHLIEHKQQHNETSSEKSDDKSVKSSLSTRDIIHECSLCYMVFPNEHSLNKHSVFCQKKKKQKQTKQTEENKSIENKETLNEKYDPKSISNEEMKDNSSGNIETCKESASQPDEKSETSIKNNEKVTVTEKDVKEKELFKENETKTTELELVPSKRDIEEADISLDAKNASETLHKIMKIEEKVQKEEIKVKVTPKNKISIKDKGQSTPGAKRRKLNLPLTSIKNSAAVESSDDDEVRYMLNPEFKGETMEVGLFMQVKAKKRNSLQFERPSSKGLMKRHTSLQHLPKTPRLKSKDADPSDRSIQPIKISKTAKLDLVPLTDSDDSDIKYSFPTKSSKIMVPEKVQTPKEKRKVLAEKRKLLSGIARKKSLGTTKHEEKASPVKPIKRRRGEVEHRCDCGQLFSSAALLARHASLAHTPPRRRRAPAPAPPPPRPRPARQARTPSKPAGKSPSNTAGKSPSKTARKSPSKTAEKSPSKTAGKSPSKTAEKSPSKTAGKSPSKTAEKSPSKTAGKSPSKTAGKPPGKAPGTKSPGRPPAAPRTALKTRKSAAHRGVPMPEKAKKLVEKLK